MSRAVVEPEQRSLVVEQGIKSSASPRRSEDTVRDAIAAILAVFHSEIRGRRPPDTNRADLGLSSLRRRMAGLIPRSSPATSMTGSVRISGHWHAVPWRETIRRNYRNGSGRVLRCRNWPAGWSGKFLPKSPRRPSRIPRMQALSLGPRSLSRSTIPAKIAVKPIGEPGQQHRPVSPVIEPQPEIHEVSEIQITPECRMICGVQIPTQYAAMQSTADRMIDDAVAVYQDPVASAADPVGIFDVTIIQRQILPASAASRARQSHAVDNGEIYQSAAPDDAVAHDNVLMWQGLREPRPARREHAPSQHLPERDQIMRRAHGAEANPSRSR